ncbi:MAG: MarR family transcriptional regulator [Desulfobacterales bacterium]|nr:MarR family transcriptional regulator [Desulfobacterales bacterium]
MTSTTSNPLTLYTRLMRATTTVTDKMHRHLQDHRLSISQFGVLEALYHLGPLCQKDIGGKILKTSGNMTLVIDNLEKNALVHRQKDPEDRRRTIVTITDKGKDLIQTIFPHHEQTARAVFSVLNPDEQKTLGALLKKLGMGNI